MGNGTYLGRFPHPGAIRSGNPGPDTAIIDHPARLTSPMPPTNQLAWSRLHQVNTPSTATNDGYSMTWTGVPMETKRKR